jgi:hypothetical protein
VAFWGRVWRALLFMGVVLGGIAAFAQLGLSPVIVPFGAVVVLLYAGAPGAARMIAELPRRWQGYPKLLEEVAALTEENSQRAGQLEGALAGQTAAFARGQDDGWRARTGLTLGLQAMPPVLLVASADSTRGGTLVLIGRGREVPVGAWFTLEIQETRDPKGIVEVLEAGPDDRCVMTCIKVLDPGYWEDLARRPRHETSAPDGAVLVAPTADVFARAMRMEKR